MAKIYKVYVCHSWSHVDDLENLRQLLNERGYFNVVFKEHSPEEPINSLNAAYVKQRLKKSILESDIVIGLAGIYSSHSDWITWELDTAIVNAINIIGVIPKKQIRVSRIVSERSIIDVEWDADDIVRAIRLYGN